MMFQLFFLIFGLIFGSFLNVIIYRLPKNESIISPASHCPDCGTRLKPIDLVPVISFFLTKGRCRYCGKAISWQYPLVELLTALLFLSLYVKYGINSKFINLLILVSLLIICSFIDLRNKIIPNKITYPGIILGFILSLFFNHITFTSALLGLLIPAGLLFLIALIFKKGMGMGDVKLVAMIGTFIGWQDTLLSIFIGSLLGSVIGLILIGTDSIERRTRIPFGPFISIGTVVMLLIGENLIKWYLGLFY